MNNLTAVLHQEHIPSNQILSSFHGRFIPTFISNNKMGSIQICIQYSSRICIYGFKSIQDEHNKNLVLLHTFEIFDKIEYSEKFNSLLNKKNYHSIVLSLSSFKISFIEYNILFNTFNTLALYTIDQFLLNGSNYFGTSFKLISSLTYNYLLMIYDDNKLGILRKKNINNKKPVEYNKEFYTDTLFGDKYFLPSIYLNELYGRYGVNKIINAYIPKKNNENLIFNGMDKEYVSSKEIDNIKIYILYIDSKIEENNDNINNKASNNNNINSNISSGYIHNTTNQNSNSNVQLNLNFFMREKISLGLLSYNCKSNEYSDFVNLFSDIDENAFDFTILENSENPNNNLAIIFSAYNLQIIKIKNKTSLNVIMNINYKNIFLNLYNNPIKFKINLTFIDKSLDLRGSGFLVINSNGFIFSDSKGNLLYTTIDEKSNEILTFEPLIIENEPTNCLGVPYNCIIMPYPLIFFLSSPYSDGIVLTCNTSKNTYKITDEIINYSPIINFHLVNDMNKNVKFAFTSGYNQKSRLSFSYEQLLFNETTKNNKDFYDVDFIKSINISELKYTKYLLCKLKNQQLIVFQNMSKDLVNITNKIEYEKTSKIISFGQINYFTEDNINTDNNNNNILTNNFNNSRFHQDNSIITLIFENSIYFFDNNFNLITILNNNNFITDLEINKIKFGEKHILLFDPTKNKLTVLGVYRYKMKETTGQEGVFEKEISKDFYIRWRDLSNYFYNQNNINNEIREIIIYGINSRLYLDRYTFLMIYRNNISLGIFDISNCLEPNDLMNIEEYKKEENEYYREKAGIKRILYTNKLNDLPPLILDDNLNRDILYRTSSDLTIDFSKNINTLFEINEYKSVNEPPGSIYFDNLENMFLLALMYKSGLLVIYSLFISEFQNDINFIGLFKNYSESLNDIDYKEFFMLDLDKLFIKFDNIDGVSGIFFNLENNRKIIYDKQGELCLMKIDNNNTRHNFNSFTNFSSEEIDDGFIMVENGIFKYCSLYKNYHLSSYSLLTRNINIKRFPVQLTYTPEYNSKFMFYSFFMIEKEMISSSKFQYYMTLRNEEGQLLSEEKFNENESVLECNVIDIPSAIGSNSTKKYIAVGINVINEEKGEMLPLSAKIKIYSKDKGKFEKIVEKEIFKGGLTMIQIFNSFLLIGEGSKINIYQFINYFELKKTGCIENKNLIICNSMSKTLLLTGDLLNSFNLMYMKYNSENNKPELKELAGDNSKLKITACNFWIVQSKKGCILFDEENNGYVYLILEEGKNNSNFHSSRICDFCINKVINEIRSSSNTHNDTYYYYYSSVDGSIGYIGQIKNDKYEKLSVLCEFMYHQFPFKCGVNPKIFYRTKNNNYQKPKGRFIDYKLLNIFIKLSNQFQEIICRNVLSLDKNTIINYINDLIS